ncbi:ABC transporter ATP-binding protein [Coralloluteibacterium stylophorae]|uniref:ATP-binding cassette domain-containing protein n=1 Tax=Coralloluteibacterium stylophorae TaxID=1776034 RepID=A0A8J7VUS0_9GAMM|nr:ATP-binding cassette domain-containing protein [Coralloluteibacterium stylophorae]MBS7456102.1 ATP-binding cassette domain-containing protein [Coralloluteibacterium stylophorae]
MQREIQADTEAAGGEAVIAVRDLGKSVQGPEGELTILAGVTLHVNPGESVAIVGASGSGKTTLLGLLAGLDVPTRGEIVLGGAHLERMDEEARAALRAREVGFVFQSFHLLPALTAEENVALPLELAGQEDGGRVAAALEAVGLTARRRHYPRQMSGGEQQRVALARAFVARPRILFADEPTGNLDQATGRHVGDLLFAMNRDTGTTLVLVTHDLALARRCQRVLRIEGGRLREEQAA